MYSICVPKYESILVALPLITFHVFLPLRTTQLILLYGEFLPPENGHPVTLFLPTVTVVTTDQRSVAH
jgi:hypothetical protein